MGAKFTIIHTSVMILTYLIGSFAIEKLLSAKDKEELIINAKEISK